jgi:adenylyltransferase/sulfurtransferase
MDPVERYSRHTLLSEIGREGQARIGRSTVLVVGCGALGTAQAERLARAGVGRLRVVDRDFVTESNLQRQTLFVDADVAARLPKAAVLAERLRALNPAVTVEGVVDDVNPDTILRLLDGVDLVLDATDNFETRFLVNDACLDAGIPWVYGGVVGTAGMTLNVRPGRGPCLRCLVRDLPPAGALPTCDTAGILNTLPWTIASIQVTEGLKLLLGDPAVRDDLLFLDLWSNSFQRIALKPDPTCPACAQGLRPFLRGEGHHAPVKLCGRDTVQIRPPAALALDLTALAAALEGRVAEVVCNGFLLAFRAERYEVTVFPDGRALVRGSSDPGEARAVYARYIGN